MSERSMSIAGWILTGLYTAFMLGASVMPKLSGMEVADDIMRDLGWPAGYVLTIGVIELACVVLDLWPRTSVLGAVLTMGLLGGAIATQLRAGSPLISHSLFGVYLGLVMWGGLWLRDAGLRSLFPWRRG